MRRSKSVDGRGPVHLSRNASLLLATTSIQEETESRFGSRCRLLAFPAGTAHAYRDGSAATVCGESLTNLHCWPGYDFEVLAYVPICVDCLEAADLGRLGLREASSSAATR